MVWKHLPDTDSDPTLASDFFGDFEIETEECCRWGWAICRQMWLNTDKNQNGLLVALNNSVGNFTTTTDRAKLTLVNLAGF